MSATPKKLRVDGGLGLRDLAVAHPLLGQAVVGRHLNQAALRVHVRPGVTHVGQGQRVLALVAADQGHRRQRGAHAPKAGVGLALLPDCGVRLRKRPAQPVHGGLAFEGPVQRLDGHSRRDLAADMAPHAVRHRVEVRTLERQVLIDGTDPPDVGSRAGPQDGQRETSNTVEPTGSMSPFPRRTALAICSELTYVPLVEPRSSTQSWSLCRKRRAWSVEV